MGKVIKRKVAVKAAKPREYLTITHKSLKEFGMCWHMRKLMNRTFPFAEFGARGIPVTRENALRMLNTSLPAAWVLNRYCGESRWDNDVAEQYRNNTNYSYERVRQLSKAKKAAIFVRLLTANANSHVRRIRAASKLTSLKGVTLVKAA